VKQYRAAIIGLTGIAAAPERLGTQPAAFGAAWPHSHAAAYASLSNVVVAAVCDLRESLFDEFRTNWGHRWPEVRTYTDYRRMLEQEEIDLLSVVTSDNRHTDIVVDAAAGGVKGILCEKPIATTLADADRMIAACEQHGVPMSIHHSRRWRPHWHAAAAQVGDGPLGAVRRIVGNMGGPRAMLFRNGTHLLDAICWFAGGEPDWVVGVLDEEQQAYGPRYAGDGGRDPAFDPGGTALIHFQNGVRAFVNCSKRTSARFELHVFAEHGRLRVDDSVVEVWRSQPEGRLESHSYVPAPQVQRADTASAVLELIERIEQRSTEPTLCPPPVARTVVSILLGILQSQAEGSAPVRFPITDR
jgi:UDP-N-acetyl-2-amino-2-deoxyglucuronate dehydrogenase